MSLGFKMFGLKYSEQLSINYQIVILLVFAPSLVVTIILILKKLLKN